MNLRKVTLWLAIPTLLLAAGLTTWSWLLHSESGARWLFSRLKSSIPASVGSAGISGELGSGLQLSGFYFDDRSTRVDVALLTFAVDIDLFPPSINLENLQAAKVVARTLQVSEQETETDWGNTVEGLSLPVPLMLEDIRVSDIEYFDLSGDSAFVIHSVVAAGSLHRELVLNQLAISLPGSELTVSGQLGLSAPQPLSLEFQLIGELDLTGKLDGSLESAQLMLTSGTPNLRVSGTLGQLLQVPTWDLDISSSGLQWPLQDPEPDAKLTELKAHTSGEWQHFNLDLAGNLELREFEPSRLELLGNGSGSGFTAQRITLDGADLSLQASGTISWKEQLQLGFNAVLERLDPGKWLDGWPENHPVNGELAVTWAGDELEVSDFVLAVAHTTLSASGHGVIDIPSGIVAAELSWKDFSWPPGDPAAVIHSRTGSFQVSGRPEDWKLDGALVLQAGEFPEGQLQISGAGDLESLEIKVHEGTILGGTLSGNAHWNWTETRPFNTILAIEGIDITPLLPQYPAVLNAHLAASGELEPLRLEVEIQQLDGMIQGLPINASGGFHIEQGRAYADQLTLGSGASTLFLSGGLHQPEGLDFSVNIDSLARFANELSGSISAQGNVSLHPESPAFSATLSGQHLVLGPLEIAQIETRGGPGIGVDSGPEVVLSGVVIGPRPIESLSFRFGGERPLEQFSMEALIEGTKIGLNLNGSVNDWTQPLASSWSGSLTQFLIDHEDRFIFTLDQAADIDWSLSHFRMEQACFSGTREARMCLESAWNSPDELQISADLAAIPVGLMELFTDTDVTFTQVLAGTFSWSQAAGGSRSGGARIEISPGVIKDIDDGEILLQTGPGLFGFEVSEGNLQRGKLDINFPQTGDIDLAFSLPELRSGLQSPVRGTAKIDLNDIGAVGLFLPLFDTIEGVLAVDLSLSGTLSDPAFKGKAALSKGRLENIAFGLSFSDINISGEVSEFDRSELRGSFRAGEGSGEISTSIDFRDMLAPVIKLALKGNALTVIDVPELKVVANPDLALSWQNNKLEINGRLYIPTARLAPIQLPQSTVRQSDDVVVVAGEMPVVEQDFLEENAVSMGGKLELELGDEVVIDLDLAQIRVTGKTEFAWTNEMIPIANGNFDVSGEIQAYGQFLRVTQGRIGFPGVPADNPHLNIRAEREIFGNSQIRRAGLMVAGTLRRPLIEAYTVPMTNKERAQTLLVTGSDFNFEQGVGAVDVGMYVLPRLYVSYGIGVFEDGNVLKARFDIGRGFGIRATSGQRETGLDISYTVER